MSGEQGGETLSALMDGQRTFPQYAHNHPDHLEVHRFMRQPEVDRAGLWYRRRAHAPCDVRVPPEWGLDALYFRHEVERAYCERLRNLRIDSAPEGLSLALVCLEQPWLPFLWPPPQTPCAGNFANFPPTGDLPDPDGGSVALDSPWRLRECAIRGGTGDPGRLVAETRKEYRDARKYQALVPFQQVEFYAQRGETRDTLYVPRPSWWGEAWTSPAMLVPLPPVVTYRASMLLREKAGTPESNFWWRVFEAEWVVLVFGRWCADVRERHIMWRLPSRARSGLAEIGVKNLFQQCPYSPGEVQLWLADHDAHAWESSCMPHRVRGPSGNLPALIENRVQFVRAYQASPDMSDLPRIPRSAPAVPMAAAGNPGIETTSDVEEILASGNVPPANPDPRSQVTAATRIPFRTPADGATGAYQEADDIFPYTGWSMRTAPDVSAGYPETDRVISLSLERRFRDSGLLDTLHHYAPEFHHCHPHAPAERMPLSEGLVVFAFARVTRHNRQRVREVAGVQEQDSALLARAERAELLVRVLTDELERRERGDRVGTRKRSRLE
jgi:hypothetical protein